MVKSVALSEEMVNRIWKSLKSGNTIELKVVKDELIMTEVHRKFVMKSSTKE